MSDHAASRNQAEAKKRVCKHTVIQHRHPAGPGVTPRGKREAASEASSHLQERLGMENPVAGLQRAPTRSPMTSQTSQFRSLVMMNPCQSRF